MTDGQKVQSRVEVPFPESEVGGCDGRREAVVEGLGQTQALMDAVPAELDRQLVDAQLAGVEEAVELGRGEVVLAERPELLRPVLMDVPVVVGLLRSGWRQGQQVGSGDEGDA